MLNEEVQTPGASLPGCNPIQEGPQDAVIQTNCAGYRPPSGGAVQTPAPSASAASDATQPSSSAAAVVAPPKSSPSPSHDDSPPPASTGPSTSSGSSSKANPPSVEANGQAWEYQGCYSDLVPDRSIRTLGNWGQGQTAQDCATSCAKDGYKIAGVEYGNQCFCDNKMTQTKKLDDAECNTPCTGSSQTCGGVGALQVYAASGTNLGLSKRSHNHRHGRDFFRV